MSAQLRALWTTAPLTTPAELLARSAETGYLVGVLRSDAWHGDSDQERRAIATSLQFARWRLNPDDRARGRRYPAEEASVQDRPSRLVILVRDMLTLTLIAAAAVQVAVSWVGRWRP